MHCNRLKRQRRSLNETKPRDLSRLGTLHGSVPDRQVINPSVRVSFNEFDSVALEVSRLYRNLPPKHQGRIMRAALDPFWQILSGDLNPTRNLLSMAAAAFRRNDAHCINLCIVRLKSLFYEMRYTVSNKDVGRVYRAFFIKKVRDCLSKARLWKEVLHARGIEAPIWRVSGPPMVDGSFIKNRI